VNTFIGMAFIAGQSLRDKMLVMREVPTEYIFHGPLNPGVAIGAFARKDVGFMLKVREFRSRLENGKALFRIFIRFFQELVGKCNVMNGIPVFNQILIKERVFEPFSCNR